MIQIWVALFVLLDQMTKHDIAFVMKVQVYV